MRKNFGREIALLTLPILIVAGVASWKMWTSDPDVKAIGVENLEVGAVSLERERVLTSTQAQRRVHLSAVVNWNPSAIEPVNDWPKSTEEELRAPNGQVWRSRDKSLSVDFHQGGEPLNHRNSFGRQWRKFHWMLTIPANAPAQDLRFSTRLSAPGLKPRTLTFLARPAWNTRLPPSLKFASVSWSWKKPHEYDVSNWRTLYATVRLRYKGKKPLYCDTKPISHRISNQIIWDSRDSTPNESSQFAPLIWGESQWAEDNSGKLLVDWRAMKTLDINYNDVDAELPYLNSQGLVIMSFRILYSTSYTKKPTRLRAQVGIAGEGILPLNFLIPKESTKNVTSTG